MATVGRISAVFTSDIDGLKKGVLEASSLLERLSKDVEGVNKQVNSATSKTIEVKTKVDASGVEKVRKSIEGKASTVKVAADVKDVEEKIGGAVKEAKDKAEKEKVTILGEAKDVVEKAKEATKSLNGFTKGIVIPIKASYEGVTDAVSGAKSVYSAFKTASSSVTTFVTSLGKIKGSGDGLRNTTVLAASAVTAFTALNEGYGKVTNGATGFSDSLKVLSAFGGSQARLASSLSAGGSAFVAAAASSAVYKVSMAGVNKATEDLDPALRSSIRVLAELGLSFAQTAISAKVAASAGSVIAAAFKTQATPLQSASTFLRFYSRGLQALSAVSTAAADRQAFLNSVTALFAGSGSASQKYLADFTKALTSAASWTFNFAKSLASTVVTSSVAKGAYSALGSSLSAVGGAVASAMSQFEIGRRLLAVFTSGATAVRSTLIDMSRYARVLGTSLSAAFQQLPGGTTVLKALSAGMTSLGGATGGLASALPSLGSALQTVSRFFVIGAVVSGQYKAALSQLGAEAEATRNMADRFGSTTQQMQILGQAAEDAGVSMGQLGKGQQTLFTNIGKIKIGQLNTESTREAKIAFDRLGVSLDDIKNKSPQQVFEEVAEKLTNVEDASERTAIAFDLFGKQGAAILPALKGLKEAQADAARLGTALSDVDFSMFEGVDQSFDRVKAASKNLATAMLLPIAPIQTGWNNFYADLQGGLVAVIGPIASTMAAAVVPFQVFLEVGGRIVNIMLRLVGAVVRVGTAFAQAPALATAWRALGSAVMDVLSLIEMGVGYVEAFATAIFGELNPAIDGLMEPAKTFEDWVSKLGTFAQYFGIIVVSAGVAQAAMFAMGINGGKILVALAARINLTSFSFMGLAKAALTGFRMMTVGAAQMAAVMVKNFILMIAGAVQPFIASFVASVASFVTGSTVMATSATVTGYAMAAAWVVGTLGLAAVVVAIIAVIQNFSKLYDWFSNFGDNIGTLFTFKGVAEAASAVAYAIYDAFVGIISGIAGFFTGIVRNIIKGFAGIKTPAKINAAEASAGDIVQSRKAQQQSQVDATNSANATMAGFFGASSSPVAGPTEDLDALGAAIDSAKGNMVSLTVDAARFGQVGKDAALAAQKQFDALQQQVANNTLKVPEGSTVEEEFAKRAAEIQRNLQNNISLANKLTPEQIFEFSKGVADAAQSGKTELEKLARGTDLGSTFAKSRFFPTSDEINAQAEQFQKEYEARNKAIAEKLASGGFGRDADAAKRAQKELDDSMEQRKRDMGKIEADVSFANDIRKALEDAFQTPADAFEKRLKEIANNKSLTDIEKQQATAMANRQFVEDTFGQTQGQTLRERQQSIDTASRRGAFEPGRQATEQVKLDIEKRKAAGLDATASQQLKAGAANIADVFGVTGMTLEQIQSKLSPDDFKAYQEAMKKNATAVKESLGVEQSGADKIAESRERLAKAVADRVITEEEGAKALKAQRDSLLSSLGINKTPVQEFEDTVQKLNDNAKELSSDELAKGMKEAKDKMLAALGIDKSPGQQAAESMDRLREAFDKGKIGQEELAKGTQKVKDALLQNLGIPLDPVTQLGERLGDLDEAFKQGLITQGEYTRGQEEARRSMLPGGEDESPVKKFQRDLEAVGRAAEEGLIGKDEAAARKLRLQAQLQEDIKPALDRVAPDRRAIESADVRSKAGVDTFFRILRGQDNPGLKAQLETAKNTQILAEAARNADAAPVIAQLMAP